MKCSGPPSFLPNCMIILPVFPSLFFGHSHPQWEVLKDIFTVSLIQESPYPEVGHSAPYKLHSQNYPSLCSARAHRAEEAHEQSAPGRPRCERVPSDGECAPHPRRRRGSCKTIRIHIVRTSRVWNALSRNFISDIGSASCTEVFERRMKWRVSCRRAHR